MSGDTLQYGKWRLHIYIVYAQETGTGYFTASPNKYRFYAVIE